MQRSLLPHGVAILLLASATDGSDPSFDKATPADDTGTPAITEDWRASCARMEAAGFADVASFNPHWDPCGRTFEDLDGYRVVLQNGIWARKTGIPPSIG
jgi:hypothetical protein